MMIRLATDFFTKDGVLLMARLNPHEVPDDWEEGKDFPTGTVILSRKEEKAEQENPAELIMPDSFSGSDHTAGKEAAKRQAGMGHTDPSVPQVPQPDVVEGSATTADTKSTADAVDVKTKKSPDEDKVEV